MLSIIGMLIKTHYTTTLFISDELENVHIFYTLLILSQARNLFRLNLWMTLFKKNNNYCISIK